MDDLRPILASFSAALILSAALIYLSGCDGSVAGVKIGPSTCWLKTAGR